MRSLTAVLVVGVVTLVASAAEPPDYSDYPVKEIFLGKPAAPLLSTPGARMFRTELRRQAAYGPNFAGHFTVALWGCGAGCSTVAVIDARSGEVQFAPFAIEDALGPVCQHSSDYELTSELFVAQGRVKGKVGTHYFRWHERKFSLLHFDKDCSL